MGGVHTISYTHPDKTVLELAVLRGPVLKGLGLNNDICSCDNYDDSMAVSAALHAQVPDADGIVYVSRQNNVEVAIALFERSGVKVHPISIPLRLHSGYAGVLDLYDVEVLPRTRPPPGA